MSKIYQRLKKTKGSPKEPTPARPAPQSPAPAPPAPDAAEPEVSGLSDLVSELARSAQLRAEELGALQRDLDAAKQEVEARGKTLAAMRDQAAERERSLQAELARAQDQVQAHERCAAELQEAQARAAQAAGELEQAQRREQALQKRLDDRETQDKAGDEAHRQAQAAAHQTARTLQRERDQIAKDLQQLIEKHDATRASFGTQRKEERERTRLATVEKRRLERSVERLQQTADQKAAEAREAQAALRKLEAPLQAERRRTSELQARVRSLEEDAHAATALMERAKQELDKYKKAQKDGLAATANAALAQSRTAELVAELESAHADADRLRLELQQARVAHATELNTLPELQKQWVADIAHATGQRDSALRAVSDLQAEIDRLRDSHRALALASARREREWTERAPARSAAWYLKLDDGGVLGPKRLDDLYDWACQCRIGPEHELSLDRETWVKGRDLPELHMEWMVELVDGSAYGPLNLLAVQHLVADGSALPTASLTHARSGLVTTAREAFIPEYGALREVHRKALADLESMRQELAQGQRPAPAAAPTLPPPKALRAAIQGRRPPVQRPPKTTAT